MLADGEIWRPLPGRASHSLRRLAHRPGRRRTDGFRLPSPRLYGAVVFLRVRWPACPLSGVAATRKPPFWRRLLRLGSDITTGIGRVGPSTTSHLSCCRAPAEHPARRRNRRPETLPSGDPAIGLGSSPQHAKRSFPSGAAGLGARFSKRRPVVPTQGEPDREPSCRAYCKYLRIREVQLRLTDRESRERR